MEMQGLRQELKAMATVEQEGDLVRYQLLAERVELAGLAAVAAGAARLKAETAGRVAQVVAAGCSSSRCKEK